MEFNLNRRSFVKGAAVAGAFLPSFNILHAEETTIGPKDDQINVALIGFGAEARVLSASLVRIPGVSAASSDAFGRIFALHPVLAAVSASVSGPAMEEIVFRLVPFSLIRSRNAALVVSSVLFALAHASSPLAALPYLAAGVIFGISYMRNGIAGSTLTHSIYNAIAMIL